MAHEIRVPRLGWSMEEGTFIRWLKKDGDAIRAGEPNIGEDVYAIGSPYGERFSGTLTRGVLSGHRTIDALRVPVADLAQPTDEEKSALIVRCMRANMVI